MNKKQKLAILASCMVLYSSGFTSKVYAEADKNDDTVLDEVVVTGFKEINPVKFTVITEEDLKAKGAQNAADALKDVAGLYLNSNSARGKKNAQIRGSDADNTKIFVDGVPLSPVGDGKVDLRSIPADNIEKIEVIKGAVPVIYGTNAPGGVIYITTKKAGKSAQSLTITTGSKNAETYFASIGGKTGKVSYSFGAKREDTDGFTVHSKLKADYFNGKLSWDINPKSSLAVFGSYSEREEQLPNRIDPATGLIVVNEGKGGVISGRNNFWSNSYNWEYDPVKNSYIGALYSLKLNDKNDLSLKMYQSKETSHLKGFFSPNPNDFLFQHWDGTVHGWELQHTIRTSPSNTITWGLTQETRDFSEVSSTGRSYYDYTGKSFYIQDIAKFGPRLRASFGYRHDDNEDHANVNTIAYWNPWGLITGKGRADNPVFSVNYALGEKTALHGSVGKSYRWPNARERSSPGGIYPNSGAQTYVDGQWYYIMPDGSLALGVVCEYLLPEEVINREVGLEHFFNSHLAVDVTYFNKDITNMIKGQGFSQGHTQYYNIPHVDMKGYEVEVKHKIGRHLKGFFNYTYTNALDTLLQSQVRDIPYRKYSFGLNYEGRDGINANLAVNYIGSCTSAFSNGNGSGNGDKPLEVIVQKLPAYHVVDFKVSKAKENRDYYLKITNLLDKKYYQGAYLIAPGRYIEMGTTIKF